METIKQLSVIIPVYNVSPYLPQCLNSLYKQTDNSIEIILVNDGSTDNSKEVCEQYCGQFPNTFLINKENGGLSDARNTGTFVASGKYIYYLDSDDWLAPNAIQKLYEFAVQNDCEVVQGGFYYAYDDYLLFDNSRMHPQILSRKEAMWELILNDYIKNFAWGKLYRADIVKKHPFPVGKYYEDSYWQHLIIHETNRYGILPEPLYYYRQRNSGISGEFSIRNIDLLEGYEKRMAFVKYYYPEYVNQMSAQLWKMGYSMLSLAKKSGETEIRQVFQAYWNELNNNYQKNFEDALASSDLQYKIVNSCSHLMPLYSFYKRIIGRMKPSNRYQRIKRQDERI